MNRRALVLALAVGLALSGGAEIAVAGEPAAIPVGPGDYGYQSAHFANEYRMALYGHYPVWAVDNCRATLVRPTKLNSPVGLDAMVDGTWKAVPKTAYQPPESAVPTALEEEAHVCASGFPERIHAFIRAAAKSSNQG